MTEFKLIEGSQRRDFSEVIWQISETRGCDEVLVQYDCGHAIRAEVLAPTFPKSAEYFSTDAECKRLMRHTFYVLTRHVGATHVQITVPEGRCRACGRGQRCSLICGSLQMNLTDSPNATRRLDLPLSGHAFLSMMGQVCRLPDGFTPPPISHGKDGAWKPFDGSPMPKDGDGLQQWSRRDVEDGIDRGLGRCVNVANFIMMCMLSAAYAYMIYFIQAPAQYGAGAAKRLEVGLVLNGSTPFSNDGNPLFEALENLSSVSGLEKKIANLTWALSYLTVAVHTTFGPETLEDVTAAVPWWWAWIVHPMWVGTSAVFLPCAWAVETFLSPMCQSFWSMFIRAVWHPLGWFGTDFLQLAHSTAQGIVQVVVMQPFATLSQIPMKNPGIAAVVISLTIAAFAAPQHSSVVLPSSLSEFFPGPEFFEWVKRSLVRSSTFAPLIKRFPGLFNSRQESRNRGGTRGVSAARGSKDRPNAGIKDGPNRSIAGKHDGRAQATVSQQRAGPACFVCLDRPSCYIVEPCGHRVACGACAMQLVDAAARFRSANEAGGGHSSERLGGSCPSCGTTITRAMRLFS